MAVTQFKPNDRYAIIGKTRSGKTAFAMVLAGTFALSLPPPWEVWWIDTKGDPNDIRKLRRWGFRNAINHKDQATGGLPNAFYFLIAPIAGQGEDSVANQAQEIIGSAYKRRHVLIVIDEYKQVVVSDRTPGVNLKNVFERGGGLNVGVIGLTQEPVFIPRGLLSQSTHMGLFNLTYARDIQYVRQFNHAYKPPNQLGDPYGFWWAWVDGPSGVWSYYANQRDWYEDLRVSLPRSRMPVT